MHHPFVERVEGLGAEEVVVIGDAPSGLRALVVIDDTTLGPAAGGVRTRRYATELEALEEVAGLARAMTLKCALAGLDAGGGKAVVLEHPALDRPRAFAALGRAVERLGGRFRTAGDLGTGAADLAAMARHTRFVHAEEAGLAASVARGLAACLTECLPLTDLPRRAELRGLRVLVQGVGSIGAAVAVRLRELGVRLSLSDLDEARAEELARRLGAVVVPAAEALTAEVDVLVPCAVGRVLTAAVAERVVARCVVPGANDVFGDDRAERVLVERGVVAVPDTVSSAGAVVDGIGRTVMGLGDRAPLLDRLGVVAREIVEQARRTDMLPGEVARARARARIAAARGAG